MRFGSRGFAIVAAASFAACGHTSAPEAAPLSGTRSVRAVAVGFSPIQPPVLISWNRNSGSLEAWHIYPKGAANPYAFAKLPNVIPYAMAANGDSLIMAQQSPPEIVRYNVNTKAEKITPDPYGTPLDIVIDKNRNVFVPNAGSTASVTMYPYGSGMPVELFCGVSKDLYGIAADDKGDIFSAGDALDGSPAIFEIPSPSDLAAKNACFQLNLRRIAGVVSGLQVDPKTGDLIVMDNPSQCAGGAEGRLTIYSKPYEKTRYRIVTLGGNCPSGLLLNATSTAVFYSDADVSSSFTFIRQSSYPEGRRMGGYWNGAPGPFTTIPNILPN